MSWAINGLLRGEFLQLPGVGTAAAVGTTSTVMWIGLNILGHPASENVVTAVFAVTGTIGIAVTVVGAIAYSIFATQMQRGNDHARRGY